jgi:ABC-type proline/glycine betaine transport system ATPase subunit
MRGGRVVQQGSLAEMWQSPTDPFVRQFIQAQRRSLPLPDAPT